MPGISNLDVLIRSMRPEFRHGEFVFVYGAELPDDIRMEAMVRETEGASAVIARSEADRLGLHYEFVAAWITLTVVSPLDGVGLTAAVASELASIGISCNVIAGYHHDHLLVPIERADDALSALRRLAGRPLARNRAS